MKTLLEFIENSKQIENLNYNINLAQNDKELFEASYSKVVKQIANDKKLNKIINELLAQIILTTAQILKSNVINYTK